MKECDGVDIILQPVVPVEGRLVLDTVLSLVRKKIKATPKELVQSIASGMSYRAVVFLLISNVTWEELHSGRHHVYRGALSLTGEGLKQLFDLASDALVSLQFHSKAEANAEKASLMEGIRGLG